MIEVRELVKRYGDHLAVDRVSFSAGETEILGLLGANGAGKTSVMRVLTGCLAPTSGTARVGGFDVQKDGLAVRWRLGYLPENPGLYTEMRVSEYLEYRSALRGLDAASAHRSISVVLERCGLGPVRDRIVDQLSKGYRQRVALAATLLHDPEVLILDEPTVGLDPLQMREIRGLVRDLGRDRTVLFSTHILSEAEAVCDRVVILNRGRISAEGDPRSLAAQYRRRELRVTVEGDVARARSALSAISGVRVQVAEEGHGRLRVLSDGPSSPEQRAQMARALWEVGCVPTELALEPGSLDEAFARIAAEDVA